MTATCPACHPPLVHTVYTLYRKPEVQNIVAITYYDGIPTDVATENEWDHTGEPWYIPGSKPRGWAHSCYNFDYCRAGDELYYHLTAFGGGHYECHVPHYVDPYPVRAQLWLAKPMQLVGYNRALGRGELLVPGDLARRGVELIDEPLELSRFTTWDPAPVANPFKVAENSEGNYCDLCHDWYPDGNECKHMDWCDVCDYYVYLLDNGKHTHYDHGPQGKPADHPLDGEEPENDYYA